jgi:hypothetical protein
VWLLFQDLFREPPPRPKGGRPLAAELLAELGRSPSTTLSIRGPTELLSAAVRAGGAGGLHG